MIGLESHNYTFQAISNLEISRSTSSCKR